MGRAATRSTPPDVTQVPDLEARHAQVLDRAWRLLARREREPAVSDAELFELADLCDRLASLRIAYEDATAEQFCRTELIELGRQLERDAQAARQVPRQGRHATRRPLLNVVRGLAPVAAGLGILRRLAAHPAAAKVLGAHATVKVAAIATAGTVAGVTGVAVIAANVILPSSPHAGSYVSGPAPAATAYAASPFDSDPAAALTRPRTGTADVKHAKLDEGGILPVLSEPALSSSVPSSSAPSSSQVPSSQPPGGPAVLAAISPSIDLSSGQPVTITLTAAGSGWVSWNVDTMDPATQADPGDLDFSATHGVLQAGQSVQVIVSVDPNQAVTGDATETFEINGMQVTATLPAPVAAPTPAVTDVPTDTPTPTSP